MTTDTTSLAASDRSGHVLASTPAARNAAHGEAAWFITNGHGSRPRSLDHLFDLGELRGRITLVQRDDHRVQLVVLRDYVHSDEADELERLVCKRGLQLGVPSRLVAPAAVILAMSEGQIVTMPARVRDGSALDDAFDEIVAWALNHHASDIHFNVERQQPQSQVWFTIDGRYALPARFSAVPTSALLDMLAVAWMRVRGGNGAVFDPHVEQQGRIQTTVSGRPVMLRWASLASDRGPSVCVRLLRLDASVSSKSLGDLGYLPSQVAELMQARARQGGAIVLAGTVGAGKSTTLATLLSDITSTRKLITLEDPVEYAIPGAIQNTISRRLDSDDDSVFDAKLRTIKRSALDDLLVGEVRDAQTGRAFMDMAISGIRVYATLHTHAAMLIPDRLASDFIGVSRQLLASPGILKLLVYQCLVPALCEACARPWDAQAQGLNPARENVQRYLIRAGALTPRVRMRNPTGCEVCRRQPLEAQWGYGGRAVVAESIAADEDDAILACLRMGDNRRLARHLKAKDKAAIGDADMTNKSVVECALYKASVGLLDPCDVISLFGWGS